MKSAIINLRKYGFLFSLLKLTLITFLIFSIISNGFNIYTSSEKYLSTLREIDDLNLIIIDAGHGGEDPGAIAEGDIYEKDLNLEIAFTLGSCLEEAGYVVLYTRTEDKLLYGEDENIKGIRKISDLKNRCKIAAEYPNSIFISIHMNSYGDSRYNGLQVYYQPKNEYSKILASEIQTSVKERVQPENKRSIVKGDKIYLLENISSPSILIECGFLSNKEECEKLLKKEYQKQLSLSIVYGIIEYRKVIQN